MTITLWIINGLLTLLFLASGSMKLARPKAALVTNGMGWAQDFSDGNVKLIGLAELLGGLGLILPFALGIAPVLTPIAAVCLAIIMVGATLTHARRKESPMGSAVLGLLCAVSAVIGFVVVL